MGWKPVTAHYSNPYKDTVYITIRDEKTGGKQSLVSNKIHPFFVQVQQNPNLLYLAKTAAGNALPVSSEGHHYQGPIANGHWVDAAHLKPGYRLLNSDESWSEVISIRVEKKPLKAWNITVADTHTFFVRGSANDNAPAVWVHNCGGGPREPLGGKAPHQVTPGTRTLNGQYVDDVGRVSPWTAHYDQYGRQIGRTDYNAGNLPEGIPDVHHHTYGPFGRQYGPNGRETSHIPGVYQ